MNTEQGFHYVTTQENFVKLVQELREEFDKRGWLLTAAVSAGEPTILDAYDVPTLARLYSLHCLLVKVCTKIDTY